MMMLALLLAAGQTARAPSVPVAQKFSILIPTEECKPQKNDAGEDIIVCATIAPPPPIPYPDEAYGPRPSNPYKTGAGALEAETSPCATIQRGCQVGFGPPIVPIIRGIAGVVGRSFAKKPDTTGRVAIPLDDAPPPPSRIEP